MSSHTSAEIRRFGSAGFDHQPYSPDLTPSDFHLFSNLKTLLLVRLSQGSGGDMFPSTRHHVALMNYPEHWWKCMDSRGDYIEN
jgi:hypothetical protein